MELLVRHRYRQLKTKKKQIRFLIKIFPFEPIGFVSASSLSTISDQFVARTVTSFGSAARKSVNGIVLPLPFFFVVIFVCFFFFCEVKLRRRRRLDELFFQLTNLSIKNHTGNALKRKIFSKKKTKRRRYVDLIR